MAQYEVTHDVEDKDAWREIEADNEDEAVPNSSTYGSVTTHWREMREAAVAVVRCVGYDLTTARAIDRLRAALASEAGR